ncbi:MAG: prolipoprotein diacylglyceryl transferase [Sandaracinaceae bacterium]
MVWDIDPVILRLEWLDVVGLGWLEIRYYGVFFALGLLLAASVMPRYFEERRLPREHADTLTWLLPVAMIVGAHLGHLVFYEPESFWRNPRRIIEIGSGLASHGGALGAALAVIFFARSHRRDVWVYLDATMCVAVWVIPWVRIGNFFNSEIVGRPWDGAWAVIFPRHDCPGFPDQIPEICAAAVPRHPTQIYEALIGFGMIAFGVYLQKRWRDRLRPGATFALLLLTYFIARTLVEFFKEYQVLDQSFPLTMGQLLSLPVVLFCLWVLFLSRRHNILTLLPPKADEPEPPPPSPEEGAAARRPRKKKRKKRA